MYKVGLSSCGFPLTEENFKGLEQAQISAVEICMPADKYSFINYRELSQLSLRYGIKLWSYHLPFMPFDTVDISSMSSEIRNNTVKLYTDMIQKAADIGIDKFIVHPSGEPISDSERHERLKYSMQTLDRLAEIAYENGAVIAVEDLPRSCLGNTADEILKLISANDKLRVCFDSNHLLKDTNLNFIKKLSDKIVTVHISDYDFVDEKHWLPGEGLVNWAELLGSLRQINYRGVWLYEISLSSSKQLARSRSLTFDDFKNNAVAIFEGKAPERIL